MMAYFQQAKKAQITIPQKVCFLQLDAGAIFAVPIPFPPLFVTVTSTRMDTEAAW